MSRIFLWVSGSIIYLDIQYISGEQLSLSKYYIQPTNIQYFHRVEQRKQYHTVSWNFYNSYKHISRYITQHNVIWQIHQFYDLLCQFGSVILVDKELRWLCMGENVFKDFSKHTFICIWSWVLNEGRKLGKDVHTGGVWLWVSRSQLDVPADRTHTWKTYPHHYLCCGILDWLTVLLKEIFVSISDTLKADGRSTVRKIGFSVKFHCDI